MSEEFDLESTTNAAKKGNVDAMNALGDYYSFSGDNIEEAKKWYKKASKLGHKDAQIHLDAINLSEAYLNQKTDAALSKAMFKIITMTLDIDESKITDNADFEKDLGADDLDMHELIYIIERYLSASFPDDELCDDINDEEAYHFKFRTVADLINLYKKYAK